MDDVILNFIDNRNKQSSIAVVGVGIIGAKIVAAGLLALLPGVGRGQRAVEHALDLKGILPLSVHEEGLVQHGHTGQILLLDALKLRDDFEDLLFVLERTHLAIPVGLLDLVHDLAGTDGIVHRRRRSCPRRSGYPPQTSGRRLR